MRKVEERIPHLTYSIGDEADSPGRLMRNAKERLFLLREERKLTSLGRAHHYAVQPVQVR